MRSSSGWGWKAPTAVIASVLLVVGLVSPAAHALGPSATLQPRTESGSQYSDEQVVAGVLFADGPVAEALGIASEPSPDVPEEVVAEAEKIKDVLLADVIASNPQEVADAVQGLRSGDPYAVEDAQGNLSDLFKASLSENYPEYRPAADVHPMCGAIAACVAFSILAVVGGVAIAVVGETLAAGHGVIYSIEAMWDRVTYWTASLEQGEPNVAVPTLDAALFTARIAEVLGK